MRSKRSEGNFWLISVPNEPRAHERLSDTAAKLADYWRFHIPSLKVSTLDQLLELADDLETLEKTTESSVRNVAQFFAAVLSEYHKDLHENFAVGNRDIVTYLTKFQWEAARYSTKLSLTTITENITKLMYQIENGLKEKSSKYEYLKSRLEEIDRNSNGPLVSRDISSLVKADDFVLGSEYLQTLMVAVPRTEKRLWMSSYATFSSFVVPFSSKLIADEADYCLFSVTLFKKVIQEFKARCDSHRFIVRDFVYDESVLEAGRDARYCILQEKNKCVPPLIRWLRVNFGEIFSAHIHVKALRVYVESVLRFGLPVNFHAVLLRPREGTHRKLKIELDKLYKDLDAYAYQSMESGKEDKSPVAEDEYHPYVLIRINLDFFQK
ncbi:hypothetical protein QR680_010697 [Steinernema hermaphroditum]|uniref:V-type proton ATPase subunit C n=1 Tax=Steinernema hermaphroditum TaxID=289476 RepID=A0AA39IPU7_9BILA|nr:hypothetical protein QR680_010697 [Steinernema hermaphroditum]